MHQFDVRVSRRFSIPVFCFQNPFFNARLMRAFYFGGLDA
jgi:hypothetical protein